MRLASLVLVLAMLSAGCTESEPPSGAGIQPAGAEPEPLEPTAEGAPGNQTAAAINQGAENRTQAETWRLEGVHEEIELRSCDHADLYMFVPATVVRPFVPDDFDVAIVAGDGDAPVAMITAGTLDCATFSGLGRQGAASFAWFNVVVVPRHAELVNPDATIHMLRLEHFEIPGPMQAVWQDLGDQIELVDRIDTTLGQTAAGFSVATKNGTMAASTRSGGLAPAAAFDGFTLREFGIASNGYPYFDLVVAPQDDAVGFIPATFSAPPGSMARAVAGDDRPGTLLTARFDFIDAAMGFVPMGS